MILSNLLMETRKESRQQIGDIERGE